MKLKLYGLYFFYYKKKNMSSILPSIKYEYYGWSFMKKAKAPYRI